MSEQSLGEEMSPKEHEGWERYQIFVIEELKRIGSEQKELRSKQNEMATDVKQVMTMQSNMNKNLRRTVHLRSSITGFVSGFVAVIGAFFFELFNRR
jgi:hypothetical protein